MELQCVMRCPGCQYAAIETMPTDACQRSYHCRSCGYQMRPTNGRRCVFCSYGSVPCPTVQAGEDCCEGSK
jgi:hypothetical protein